MPILRGVLGKVPSGPKARVRNFFANKEVGTKSDIHENVISPGVIVPSKRKKSLWFLKVTVSAERKPARRRMPLAISSSCRRA